MWHIYEADICIPNFCGTIRVSCAGCNTIAHCFVLPQDWLIDGNLNLSLVSNVINRLKIFCSASCRNSYLLTHKFGPDRGS
jgi:hypothetical protein